MINLFHLKVQNPVFPIQLMSLFTSGTTRAGCPNEPIIKKKNMYHTKNWSVTHMYYTHILICPVIIRMSRDDHDIIFLQFTVKSSVQIQKLVFRLIILRNSKWRHDDVIWINICSRNIGW